MMKISFKKSVTLLLFIGAAIASSGCSKDGDKSNHPGQYPHGPYDPNGNSQNAAMYSGRMQIVDLSSYRSLLKDLSYCAWSWECKAVDGRPRIVIETYPLTSNQQTVSATITLIPFTDGWGSSPLQPVRYRVNFYQNGGSWTGAASTNYGSSWGMDLQFEALGDLKQAYSLPIRVHYEGQLILQGEGRR